jgi:hypothetical protein
MGVLYSVEFTASTLTASTPQDAFSLKSAVGTIGRLYALYLSQSVKAQDANDAQIAYQIKIGATTQGSGGGTPTPVAPRFEGSTSGMTAHTNDTTQASAGTVTIPHSDAFNDRAGLIFIPLPEMRELYTWGGATAMCLQIAIAAPSQTYTSGFNGTLYWEECKG